MHQPVSVLVTDASSYKAAVICRYLKQTYPSIRVLASDHRPLVRLLHTRFCDEFINLPKGPESGGAYVDALSQAVQSFDVDLLIPVNSSEIPLILRNRESFKKALDYMGDFDTFSVLSDKNQLAGLLEGTSIRRPRSYDLEEECEFPIVVKPADLSSSKGVSYCHNSEELQQAKSKLISAGHSPVIQQYVGGFGAGYSVLAREGKILAGYGHKRLIEYPISGGSSMYRAGYANESMLEVAEVLLTKTQWSGFAMFEFKIDSAENPWLIEVNPRIWGSVHQGLANGVDYFAPLLGLNAERSPMLSLRTYFSPFVYFSIIQHLLSGELAPAKCFFSHLPHNRADVPLFSDTRAWLGSFSRLF